MVKLSSPNLNYIIIAGVALLYTSVFMYTYTAEEATAQTLICNVSTMHRKTFSQHAYNVAIHMHVFVSAINIINSYSFDNGCSRLVTVCALLCF